MAELNTMPQEVNVEHYGGDTLTIHIKATPEVIAGRVFNAQIRGKTTAAKIDAEFGVILTAEGCDIVLASADAKRLTQRGDYEGYWDVQLSMNGDDPVTTLGYGTMLMHPDVTRMASA